jgi:hypothetical protein
MRQFCFICDESGVMRKPYVLIILDGFGHSESSDSNAIKAGKMPNWQHVLDENAHGLISGSGEDVGLPDGQMGNSEVGHMNLGAGRVVYQDFTRVTKSIRDGDFFTNPAITSMPLIKPLPRIKRCIFGAYYRKVACIRTKTIYTRWLNWPPSVAHNKFMFMPF